MKGWTNSEYLVLGPLEDSPLPLRELRWPEAPTGQDLADVLAPGLPSLTARGLIEVRRFHRWLTPWDEGVPLTGTDLARAVPTRRRGPGVPPASS